MQYRAGKQINAVQGRQADGYRAGQECTWINYRADRQADTVQGRKVNRYSAGHTGKYI